jgi:hypothetical protein
VTAANKQLEPAAQDFPRAAAQALAGITMRFCLVLLSSTILAGCDPGWRYHLAPPLVTVPVTKSEPIRVELVRADVFSLGFDVTVNVTNAIASDIVIDAVLL